jgi:hypothetical protein
MSEAPTPYSEEDLPTPAVRNRRWIPRLVWVVPIVAAVIGISLLVRNWENEGPRITMSFLSGEPAEGGHPILDRATAHRRGFGVGARYVAIGGVYRHEDRGFRGQCA